MDRRDFLRQMTAATAGLMVTNTIFGKNEYQHRDRLGPLMPVRQLGNTGQKVTLFGVGGWHIRANCKDNFTLAVETALEKGVRFFDNAEAYQNGSSEEYYGKYLTPKYRDVAFIMTKTRAKDEKSAQKHLEDSLRRMNTDYLDLWQIHAIDSPEDVDERLKNGVLDYALKAKQQGKVKYIGFTGHKTPDAHLRMLEQTDEGVFDACQMPINVVDPGHKSFIKNVLPKLTEKKIGVLAMKTAAYGNLFESKVVPNKIGIDQLHNYVLSLPVSVLIGGFDSIDQMEQRIDLVSNFSKLDQIQKDDILAKVADRANGELEDYKKVKKS